MDNNLIFPGLRCKHFLLPGQCAMCSGQVTDKNQEMNWGELDKETRIEEIKAAQRRVEAKKRLKEDDSMESDETEETYVDEDEVVVEDKPVTDKPKPESPKQEEEEKKKECYRGSCTKKPVARGMCPNCCNKFYKGDFPDVNGKWFKDEKSGKPRNFSNPLNNKPPDSDIKNPPGKATVENPPEDNGEANLEIPHNYVNLNILLNQAGEKNIRSAKSQALFYVVDGLRKDGYEVK